MADREQVRQQMSEDGVEYILAQFVDINGSPKVKMVPVAHFDDIIDEGAGFAGAAVWGMGQGPHSHDMLGRIDLDSYSVCPWTEGVARFASDLYVDDEPHPTTRASTSSASSTTPAPRDTCSTPASSRSTSS